MLYNMFCNYFATSITNFPTSKRISPAKNVRQAKNKDGCIVALCLVWCALWLILNRFKFIAKSYPAPVIWLVYHWPFRYSKHYPVPQNTFSALGYQPVGVKLWITEILAVFTLYPLWLHFSLVKLNNTVMRDAGSVLGVIPVHKLDQLLISVQCHNVLHRLFVVAQKAVRIG